MKTKIQRVTLHLADGGLKIRFRVLKKFWFFWECVRVPNGGVYETHDLAAAETVRNSLRNRLSAYDLLRMDITLLPQHLLGETGDTAELAIYEDIQW